MFEAKNEAKKATQEDMRKKGRGIGAGSAHANNCILYIFPIVRRRVTPPHKRGRSNTLTCPDGMQSCAV